MSFQYGNLIAGENGKGFFGPRNTIAKGSTNPERQTPHSRTLHTKATKLKEGTLLTAEYAEYAEM